MPDEVPPRRSGDMSVAWSFAVLAAVIVLIFVGWGFGGRGGGWGRNEMAHMLPPAVSSANSPATRAWTPSPNSH